METGGERKRFPFVPITHHFERHLSTSKYHLTAASAKLTTQLPAEELRGGQILQQRHLLCCVCKYDGPSIPPCPPLLGHPTLISPVCINVCLSSQSHKVAANYMVHRFEMMVEAAGQSVPFPPSCRGAFLSLGEKNWKCQFQNGTVDGRRKHCIHIEFRNIGLFGLFWGRMMRTKGQQRWHEVMVVTDWSTFFFFFAKQIALSAFVLSPSPLCELCFGLDIIFARQMPCSDFWKWKKPDSSIIRRFLVD